MFYFRLQSFSQHYLSFNSFCILCEFLFISSHQTHSSLNIRPEIPPNTPQRVRIAAQQSERSQRVLDSPEHRRSPNPHGNYLPPPRLNLPNIPAARPALPNNNADPFA